MIFWYPYSSTSMDWGLRRVVPAAAVTTHAKPHAQQQLACDLEVECAAMGQRCRLQSFGEVQRGNPQPRRWLDFLWTADLLLYSYKNSRGRACNLIPTSMFNVHGTNACPDGLCTYHIMWDRSWTSCGWFRITYLAVPGIIFSAYHTVQVFRRQNLNRKIAYCCIRRCSLVLLASSTKEYTHPYSMMHRR